jgi:hypothetical protein
LECLLSAYSNPDVVGVGGSAVADWETGRPSWFPEEFDWVVGCSYRGLPERTARIRNPIGCNMSFRRDRLADAGGFNESVGRVGNRMTGGDETEAAIRVQRANPGTLVVYEPAARVRHHVPASRSTWRYFRGRCFGEGISKALVRRLSGASDALKTERRYVRRVLPAGVVRGIGQALRGHPSGLLNAGAILAGLAITSLGFAYGSLAAVPIESASLAERAVKQEIDR